MSTTGEKLRARVLEERKSQWSGKGAYKEPVEPKFKVAKLPSDTWTVVSIDQIAIDTTIGLVRSAALQNSNKEGVPYLKMDKIDMEGRVDLEDLVYVDATDEELQRFSLRKGDVLFNTRNSVELVGKTGYVAFEPSTQTVFNNNLMRLRFVESVLPAFVATQMCSKIFRDHMEGAKRATTSIAAVYGKDLRPLPIALPPLPEQRRIVSKIEELFSKLDAGVAALKQAKAQLKRYRQSVLAAAVTGELTKEWRANNPNTEPANKLLDRIIKQRREQSTGRGKYKEPVKPKLDETSELPPSWTYASFDQITNNFDGRRNPLKRADRDKRSGPYPYYGASGIIDDIDDYLFDGDYLLIGEDGANLLARSTPIAFRASGRFWVNNHAHIVQTIGKIPLAFLELYFNGKNIERFVTGTAQPKLNQANLNKIPVPLPPIEEQEQIVAEVEARTTTTDHIEAELDQQLARSKKLRQSILKQAFNGYNFG